MTEEKNISGEITIYVRLKKTYRETTEVYADLTNKPLITSVSYCHMLSIEATMLIAQIFWLMSYCVREQ